MREFRYPELWVIATVTLVGGLFAQVVRVDSRVEYLSELRWYSDISYAQYADVRIGVRSAEREQGWPRQVENYYIDDGRGPLIHFVRTGSDETMMEPRVSSRAVIMPVMSMLGSLSGYYVIDRETREVRFLSGIGSSRYTAMAITSDGQQYLAHDWLEGRLVVLGADGTEKNGMPFAPEGWYAKMPGEVSPDDALGAFVMWAEGYPEKQLSHLYVYDFQKGTVTNLGEVPFAERLRWKDETAVEIVQGDWVDGVYVLKVLRTVSVPR